MFLEKYFGFVSRDTEDCEEALKATLPEQVRAGLQSELDKLKEIQRVLSGETQKSKVHSLRAALRWKRQEWNAEKDAAKRKRLELEVKQIEEDIKKESAKKRAK